MAGFKFRYRLCGAAPTIMDLTFKDTETLSKGDIVNLETGTIDLGATADTNLLGVVLETQAGTSGVTKAKCIVDSDAVYGVADANARVIGATLDLAGATGAQTVAASSNKEFVCVVTKSASEETLVRINVGKHFANKAQ